MTKKLLYKRSAAKIFLISFACIVLLLALITLIMLRKNLSQADHTMELLMDEVKRSIATTSINDQELFESLKDTYVISAKTVDYMVKADIEEERDLNKLDKVMQLLNIDEINFFNAEGVIVGGNVSEYYDISMQDGEQIGFFLPMLSDKDKVMTQDVLPNTVLGKEMMYTMVWREDGSELIQIGVEPVRLLAYRENNTLSNLIDSMPMTQGDILIVSKDNKVISSTDSKYVGADAGLIGINNIYQKLDVHYFGRISGGLKRCFFSEYDDYYVGILIDSKYMHDGIVFNLLLLLIFLIAVDLFVIYLVGRSNSKVYESNLERDRQLEIMTSMSQIYNSMHLINLEDDTIVEYASNAEIRKITADVVGASNHLKVVVEELVQGNYKERAQKFIKLSTLKERLKNKKSISDEFIAVEQGWIRASFIKITQKEDGTPITVFFNTQVIDTEKRKELALLYKSNTDELTRFYNRHAYEEDAKKYAKEGIPKDLVLISMDVNGLKKINDNMGHAAGDELLLGACDCMVTAFGSYGRLYRVGGDEFAALISAPSQRLIKLIKEFEDNLEVWTGKIVSGVSVSTGYASAKEFPDMTLEDLEKIADKRMYENKSLYYTKKGFDRRGQQAVFDALCDSYLKIVKANLTMDTFVVIVMDELEKEPEYGYSNSFEEWVKGFAESGLIAPEDKSNFEQNFNPTVVSKRLLKEVKPITLFYKRKIKSSYKSVVLEIVPAEDYTSENQSVFVYVKDISRFQ